MSTMNSLSDHIRRLYPLEDIVRGVRYRIVDQLAGTTELEAIGGQPRYIPTRALDDKRQWKLEA